MLVWWSQTGSNRRPLQCHCSALPAELWPRNFSGGREVYAEPHGLATGSGLAVAFVLVVLDRDLDIVGLVGQIVGVLQRVVIGFGVRTIGIVAAIVCSFVYVVAQIYGVGLIPSRFTGLEFGVGVFVGLGGILVCSMLGGMKAVTWTQIAQYIVLIIAYLTPIVILSTQKYGIPIPELTYGQAIADITAPRTSRESSHFDEVWMPR